MNARWKERLISALAAMPFAAQPLSATTIIIPPEPPVCASIAELGPEAPAAAHALKAQVPEARWRRCAHFGGRSSYEATLLTRSKSNICRLRWTPIWPETQELSGDPWAGMAWLWVGKGPCPAFDPHNQSVTVYTQAPEVTDKEFLRLTATARTMRLPDTLKQDAYAERRKVTSAEHAKLTALLRRPEPFQGIRRKSWLFGLWRTYEVYAQEPVMGFRLHLVAAFGHVWVRRVDRKADYSF